MNSFIELSKASSRSLVSLVLACLAISSVPNTSGVVPPPDGGYPNFNTAEGQNALFSLTSGAGNTAVGWFSLKSVNTGNFNTGLGAGSLVLNTGDENTAIGTAALLLNTATGNTAVGSRALLNNTTGGAVGNVSGFDIGPNVAVGQQALNSNTVASANTAVGYQALYSFTTGPTGLEQFGMCTAVGFQALANANGQGAFNSGIGYQALLNDTSGGENTAIGFAALAANVTGNFNTAIGSASLDHNTTGSGNTAVGGSALQSIVDGGENTALGNSALGVNTHGFNNTAIGSTALANNTDGSDNTTIGYGAGNGVTTASDVICIGRSVAGADVSHTTWIKNIYGTTTISGTTQPVIVSNTGQLGTISSSRRFKKQIKAMDKSSESILALQPVTFRYKSDDGNAPQFGLIAEQVAEVNPDLVVRDEKGEIYSVRYDAVNAMLLNEFLKEHKRVEEQQATISQLKGEMETLIGQLKEQASKIESVRAQMEMNIATARVAAKEP